MELRGIFGGFVGENAIACATYVCELNTLYFYDFPFYVYAKLD